MVLESQPIGLNGSLKSGTSRNHCSTGAYAALNLRSFQLCSGANLSHFCRKSLQISTTFYSRQNSCRRSTCRIRPNYLFEELAVTDRRRERIHRFSRIYCGDSTECQTPSVVCRSIVIRSAHSKRHVESEVERCRRD